MPLRSISSMAMRSFVAFSIDARSSPLTPACFAARKSPTASTRWSDPSTQPIAASARNDCFGRSMGGGYAGCVSSRKRLLRTIALFVLAYGGMFAASRLSWYVREWIWEAYSDDWWLYLSMQQLYRLVAGVAGASYATTLIAATV